MGQRRTWVLAVSAVCLSLGCGDDTKPSAGDNPDGQDESQGDGDARTVGDGDDDEGDWAPPCDAESTSQALLDDVDALDFAVAGDQIVFADWSLGPKYIFDFMHTGGIRAVKVDGTDARVLFTAPEDHRITHAFVDGTDVYFPMKQPVEGSGGDDVTYLWRMPLAGGEPVLFSKPEGSYDEDAEIFASDDDSLYVENTDQVVRVSKNDGTFVIIAELEDGGVWRPQLFDGKVWFRTGQVDERLRSVPIDGSAPAAEIFSEDPCQWYRSLSVTPAGVFCGLRKYDAEGNLNWIDDQLEEYTPDGISTPLGNKVVLYGDERMDELDVNTLEQRTLVCDATPVEHIEVREDAVYWLEVVNSEAKHRLFRAPR